MRTSDASMFNGVLFAAAGTLFIVIGVWWEFSAVTFKSTAHRAEGVVRMVWDDSTERYQPHVSYQIAGKTYEIQANTTPSRSTGDRVTVYYHPDQPHSGRVYSSVFDTWAVPLVFFVLGLCATIVGFVNCRNSRRRGRTQTDNEENRTVLPTR